MYRKMLIRELYSDAFISHLKRQMSWYWPIAGDLIELLSKPDRARDESRKPATAAE